MMYILLYPAYSLIYHSTLHQLYANGLGRPIVVVLRGHYTESQTHDSSTLPFAFHWLNRMDRWANSRVRSDVIQ
jgi:hypothetical protein